MTDASEEEGEAPDATSKSPTKATPPTNKPSLQEKKKQSSLFQFLKK